MQKNYRTSGILSIVKSLFDDTSPDMEARYLAGIRTTTPETRFLRTGHLFRAMDRLVEAGVRSMHPHAAPDEVRLRVLSRQIPADLMRRVYGWDIETKGY